MLVCHDAGLKLQRAGWLELAVQPDCFKHGYFLRYLFLTGRIILLSERVVALAEIISA